MRQEDTQRGVYTNKHGEMEVWRGQRQGEREIEKQKNESEKIMR